MITREYVIESMKDLMKEDKELTYRVAMEIVNNSSALDYIAEYQYFDISELDEIYSTEGKSVFEILSDMSGIESTDNYFYIDDIYGFISFNYLDDYYDKVVSYIDLDDIIDAIEDYGNKFDFDFSDNSSIIFDDLANKLYYADYDEDEDEK